jgi:hypothetical protein
MKKKYANHAQVKGEKMKCNPFLDSAQTKEYFDIIEEAQKCNRVKGTEYYENHHIIPKSLGGNNSKKTWFY